MDVYLSLLVIVDNFHVIAVTIAPNKANAPLIIDSDRMLAFAIPPQRLQLVARRRGQNPQVRGGMELEQLPQGNALDRAEALATMVMEKFLRLFRAKALNHLSSILRMTLYVKRILDGFQPVASMTPNHGEKFNSQCL
jgi:hypothetical protein